MTGIGIIGDIRQGRVQWLVDRLDVPVFDPTRIEDSLIHFDADGLFWNGVDLTRLDTVLLPGFVYRDPVVPAADPVCDRTLWRAGHIEDQQRSSFMVSLIQHLEARGVRTIPSFDAALMAFARPLWLDKMELAGFRMPARTMTNDDKTARAFMKRHDTTLWRPVTGRAAWQRFTSRQCDDLIAPEKPPILLAECIEGPLLRAFIAAGRLVAVLGRVGPDCRFMERLDVFWPEDIQPHEEALQRAAAVAGPAFGTIDFVDNPKGPVFYDFDPDPIFEDLPPDHADALLDRWAQALKWDTPAPMDKGDPRERPAPFLRRMLRILFQMEASKYD
ncbi:MAG: hypothetical protein U9N14_02765 [Pseudomonadota bacterium]|nr:hypothetical protein [Pseudomonadota bacterium]